MDELQPNQIDDGAKQLRLRECLQEADGFWSKQYRQIVEDLRFASGEQWDAAHKRKRKGRPCLTMNVTRTYVDRIVNPSRINPYRIAVEHNEYSEELSGAVRGVETYCNAGEAYDIAFENAVVTGIGWLLVGLYDEGGKARIRIHAPRNPCSVYIDPWAQQVDGSDAEWGVVVTYMSKAAARRIEPDYDNGSIDCYEGWQIPTGSVADVLLYERKGNGFEVSRFVGTKVVATATIDNCEWLPIIPVYGDSVLLQNGQIKWAGIVHRVRDAAKMVNFYASNEAELAALAPRSPWVIAAGQKEGFENQWATANSEAFDSLTYNPQSVAGSAVPPPFRTDNQAQTQGLIASKADSVGMFGRLTGMGDWMWGSGQQESGISRIVAQSMGEIATAQYTDNLTKSIRQVGRIVLRLLRNIGDTQVSVINSEGESEVESIEWGEIDMDDVSVSVDAGPAYESRKREGAKALMELAQQLSPEQKALTADVLTAALDVHGSKELTRRLKKMLPPELIEDEATAPDPQAMQALQQAEQTILEQQQTIDQMEGIMRQMQSAIIDNAKDREVDVLQTMIDAKVKLAVEAMKQDGANQREAAKIAAQSESEILKVVSAANLTEPVQQVVSSQVAPMVVGPQSIDDAQAMQALAAIEAVGTGENPVPSGGFTA